MKRENQALRLAQMMQNKVAVYPSYELVLPFVELERSELKKLSQQDILLLGMNTLVLVLIKDGNICANLVLKMIGERTCLEIMNTGKDPIKLYDSKKYQNILISFGNIECRKLVQGFRIDITQRTLDDVSVIIEGNKYASGSLVNVEGELAVKIEKVER